MPNLATENQASFRDDAIAGFSALQKAIPGKYLWDKEGSRIFEAITATPAYYQDATELALTRSALPDIAERVGTSASVIECGSGASRKIRQVLNALQAPACYIALDISCEFLQASTAVIAADYPDIQVHAICADYSKPLPSLPIDRDHAVLGYLPGTSIGNMVPDTARSFLAQLKKTLEPGLLLIGQDPNRDRNLLEAAYQGPLMAMLHRNLLVRLERELGAVVDHKVFRHESRIFDNRVEPHLVAMSNTQIELAGHVFSMVAGESIQTDLSWKYTNEDFRALAASAGFAIDRQWHDDGQRFSLYLLCA